MDRDDLILQKLEEMEARQKERDSVLEGRLTNLETAVRENRAELKEVRTELMDVVKDSMEQKVHQTKLEGDVHSLDFKLTGKLETLEMKLDDFMANAKEQKVDKNERWKVGGIIVSCCIAIVSLILSILTRLR